MSGYNYDVVVIGAGAGGYEAAVQTARAGLKTLLIDKSKKHIGGVCLNEGCIPAKTYLQSSEFFLKTDYFTELGIDLEIKGFDIVRLKNKAEVLKGEIRSGVSWLLDQAGVECIYANAVFKDLNLLEVNNQDISFEKCIIATGSIVKESSLLPIDGKFIITSKEVFELKTLPKSITIIGAGAIGCEFATFFNALGVDVTLIIRKEQILPSQDLDISKAILREFKKRSIKVITKATILKSTIKNAQVIIEIEEEEKREIKTDMVLVAIGRIPNTKQLGLEKTEVALDEKGFIKTDKYLQTTQENIYAIGDCINTEAFAHVAFHEAKVASQNIITSKSITSSSVIPSVVFTIPQVASCGLNEKEAKEKKIDIEIKKAYFKVNSKAKIIGDDSGFIKIIISSKSDKILGGSIIGVEATEIIHQLSFAVENELTYKHLKKSIHAHPTVSEIMSLIE